MCGVLGRLGPPRAVDYAAALASLRSRGPDGEGTWQSADLRLSLAHTKLAVVARAGNQQPAVCGETAAVLNGEFYGWRTMAATLRAAGHDPGLGDAALLPALYADHGTGLVHGLRGEFAVIVADARRRELLAFRDRFGVKPLVYAVHQGAVWIASEAKALFALGVPRTLDATSIGHALRHQYLPPSRTMFAGVHTLPPGYSLCATLDGDDALEVRVQRWATVGWPKRDDAVRAATSAALRTALDEAVTLRLDAERPVGVLLSGGIDSAAVLASAVAAHGALPAFTLRFEGAGYDEGAAAADIAQSLGAPLHALSVTHDDLLTALPAAVRAAESLCINGQMPARNLLAQAVRAHGVVVVLSGEGSDELGIGYPHLLTHAGVSLAALGAAHGPQRGVMLPDDGSAGVLAACTRHLGFTPAFLQAKVRFGETLLTLCTDDAAESIRRVDPVDGLMLEMAEVLADETEARHPAHAASWVWSHLVLGRYILGAIADAQDMAHGVESRPPFLDDAVVDTLRRASVQQQVADGQGKALLRTAMQGRLPQAVCTRAKHPFLAPPLVSTLARGSVRRTRVRDRLAAGLPHVPGLDVTRALAWLDAHSDDASKSAARDDAVLYTLMSAAELGILCAESV